MPSFQDIQLNPRHESHVVGMGDGRRRPVGRLRTCEVLDELRDGGVVSQGATGRLHVWQLGHKLLYLSHRLSVVALLNSVRKK